MKIRNNYLRCNAAHKCLSVCEREKVVDRSKDGTLTFSPVLWIVSVRERKPWLKKICWVNQGEARRLLQKMVSAAENNPYQIIACTFWYHYSLISSLYTRKLSLRHLWSYIYLWHVMVFNCFKKKQWVTKGKTLARGPSIWYDSAREVNNKTHECLKFQICCTRRNIPTLHRSSHRRFPLEVLQNSQESTCVGVALLIKLQHSGLQLY